MTEDDERERMARMCGLKPNFPQNWPVDLLDRLIAGEKELGSEWLFCELTALLRCP